MQGYQGGYSGLTDFIRAWHWGEGESAATQAFMPLAFKLGEAFQFDWSEERLVGQRELPAHAGLAFDAVREPSVLAGG